MQYLHAYLKWETMGISGIHVIPVIITCILQGMFCNTGIPRTFYGGKICSVWGIGFHAMVVFGLGKDFLFKSILGRCVIFWWIEQDIWIDMSAFQNFLLNHKKKGRKKTVKDFSNFSCRFLNPNNFFQFEL